MGMAWLALWALCGAHALAQSSQSPISSADLFVGEPGSLLTLPETNWTQYERFLLAKSRQSGLLLLFTRAPCSQEPVQETADADAFMGFGEEPDDDEELDPAEEEPPSSVECIDPRDQQIVLAAMKYVAQTQATPWQQIVHVSAEDLPQAFRYVRALHSVVVSEVAWLMGSWY